MNLSKEHEKELMDVISKYSKDKPIDFILNELGKVREKYIHELDDTTIDHKGKKIIGYNPDTFEAIYEGE